MNHLDVRGIWWQTVQKQGRATARLAAVTRVEFTFKPQKSQVRPNARTKSSTRSHQLSFKQRGRGPEKAKKELRSDRSQKQPNP